MAQTRVCSGNVRENSTKVPDNFWLNSSEQCPGEGNCQKLENVSEFIQLFIVAVRHGVPSGLAYTWQMSCPFHMPTPHGTHMGLSQSHMYDVHIMDAIWLRDWDNYRNFRQKNLEKSRYVIFAEKLQPCDNDGLLFCSRSVNGGQRKTLSSIRLRTASACVSAATATTTSALRASQEQSIRHVTMSLVQHVRSPLFNVLFSVKIAGVHNNVMFVSNIFMQSALR